MRRRRHDPAACRTRSGRLVAGARLPGRQEGPEQAVHRRTALVQPWSSFWRRCSRPSLLIRSGARWCPSASFLQLAAPLRWPARGRAPPRRRSRRTRGNPAVATFSCRGHVFREVTLTCSRVAGSPLCPTLARRDGATLPVRRTRQRLLPAEHGAGRTEFQLGLCE